MTTTDCIMILAVFLGPIVAVQLTRYLDDKKEMRGRKLDIFKTLMATRAYTVSWSHVEALNRIDLEFDSKKPKERKVIDAWKACLDLLGDRAIPSNEWGVRRIDLLVALLYEMAKVLKYDFDKTHIKNSSYSPVAHGNAEDQRQALSRKLLEVLDGNRPIPFYI